MEDSIYVSVICLLFGTRETSGNVKPTCEIISLYIYLIINCIYRFNKYPVIFKCMIYLLFYWRDQILPSQILLRRNEQVYYKS